MADRTIPVLYRYTHDSQKSFPANTASSPVPGNCTNKMVVINATAGPNNCSFFSWGEFIPDSHYSGSCSAEAYAGSVCSEQLMAWQDCAIGGEEEVVLLDATLPKGLSQLQKEKEASQFLQLLRECAHSQLQACLLLNDNSWINCFSLYAERIGSNHCQRVAGLLVCQSYFPLCDACQSGNSYLASREECERVSMGSVKRSGPLPESMGSHCQTALNCRRKLLVRMLIMFTRWLQMKCKQLAINWLSWVIMNKPQRHNSLVHWNWHN